MILDLQRQQSRGSERGLVPWKPGSWGVWVGLGSPASQTQTLARPGSRGVYLLTCFQGPLPGASLACHPQWPLLASLSGTVFILATSPRPASTWAQVISFVSCRMGPNPELLQMEEQDVEALDILTPLLLMRKHSPENVQEQVAGTQARNQILSISLEAPT